MLCADFFEQSAVNGWSISEPGMAQLDDTQCRKVQASILRLWNKSWRKKWPAAALN